MSSTNDPSDADRKQHELRRAAIARQEKELFDKLVKERAPEYEKQAELKGVDDPELCKQIAIETSQILAKAWTTPGVIYHLQERTAFDEAVGRALDGTLLSKEQEQSAQPKGPENAAGQPQTPIAAAESQRDHSTAPSPTASAPSEVQLPSNYRLSANEIVGRHRSPLLQAAYLRQEQQDQLLKPASPTPMTPSSLAARGNNPSERQHESYLVKNFVSQPLKSKIEEEMKEASKEIFRSGRSR